MDYYGRGADSSAGSSSPFQAPRGGPTIFTSSDPAASLTMIRSHVCAIIICYLVGAFGMKVFYVIPILALFWHHWRECYQAFEWITRLRCEQYEIRKAVHRNSAESVQWINDIVKRWWLACDQSITDFVKDWMEPIISKFKLDHFVEYLKILTFNIGPYRSKFSNLQILQKVSKPKGSKDDVHVFIPITFDNLLHPPIVSTTEGKCTYAIEVDAELEVPSADFKMQAKLGGFHQKLLMNVESFHLSGRAQCVINIDRRAPFPHLSTADVCFLPTPKLKVNCRTLKDMIELQTTPLVKQIGEKYIERGFQRILVYPKKEHIDFTPTPPPGNDWTSLRRFTGLSQGVLTVKIEPLSAGSNSPINKKISFGNHFIKFTMGSQKCSCDLNSTDDWSSTFSFLVHDCTTEKLTAKLKVRHKIRQVSTIENMEISLVSLGLEVEQQDNNTSINKKVQMSGGGIQFLFSLCYSPLPCISLTYPITALNNCSMEDSGVLYIHVHACRGIANRTNKPPNQPYCIVRQGTDIIFKTHTLSGSSLVSYMWERGVELLVRSCRGLELTFEVLSDDGMLSTHDALGWTTLRLNMGQPQLIQNRLPLTCPMRKLSRPAHSLTTPPACIYVSVIYRNVQSVNLTRDSLQKAFMERTRQGSTASCLDQTTRFLNPTFQGYEVINVNNQVSSDDEDYLNESATPIDHTPTSDYSNRIVSSPEDSLRFTC